MENGDKRIWCVIVLFNTKLSSSYIHRVQITPMIISNRCDFGHDIICDRIWENPPYGICARFALLVAQV